MRVYVCVCVHMLDTYRSQNNLWKPVLSLHPVVLGLNPGLAAGASLLSCLSLIFHLFDDRRYSSSYEVVISLQLKFGCLKQLGTDLVTGFNRSVDHLYVFFWGGMAIQVLCLLWSHIALLLENFLSSLWILNNSPFSSFQILSPTQWIVPAAHNYANASCLWTAVGCICC